MAGISVAAQPAMLRTNGRELAKSTACALNRDAPRAHDATDANATERKSMHPQQDANSDK